MREATLQLFESYLEKYSGAVDRALADTVQSIALLGLWRGGFFADAAFICAPGRGSGCVVKRLFSPCAEEPAVQKAG